MPSSAETTISAIFAAAREDPRTAAIADAFAKAYAEGSWTAEELSKILQQGAAADQ